MFAEPAAETPPEPTTASFSRDAQTARDAAIAREYERMNMQFTGEALGVAMGEIDGGVRLAKTSGKSVHVLPPQVMVFAPALWREFPDCTKSDGRIVLTNRATVERDIQRIVDICLAGDRGSFSISSECFDVKEKADSWAFSVTPQSNRKLREFEKLRRICAGVPSGQVFVVSFRHSGILQSILDELTETNERLFAAAREKRAAARERREQRAETAGLTPEERARRRQESAEAAKLAKVQSALDAARPRGNDALIEAMFDLPPWERALATAEDRRFYEENGPKTTKQWSDEGFKPAYGEQPWRIVEFRLGLRRGTATAHFWRREQLVERKPRIIVAEPVAATPENIAAAVFAVNRAAKRRRDAAASAYDAGTHGFAKQHSKEKSALYEQKDRGIAWLASEGHLQPAKIHGSLVVWGGLGYSFHSRLKPRGVELERDAENVFRAEAKPAASSHMRIVDAKALLAGLDDRTSRFDLLAGVEMKRAPKPRRRRDEFDDEEDFE